MDEVAGQSKQFAPPGQKIRLPVAHMVSLKPFHVSQNRDSSLRHRPVLAAWRKAGWRLDLIGQSRLFATAGQKVRLPVCNMVRPHCATRRLVAPKLMSVLH